MTNSYESYMNFIKQAANQHESLHGSLCHTNTFIEMEFTNKINTLMPVINNG